MGPSLYEPLAAVYRPPRRGSPGVGGPGALPAVRSYGLGLGWPPLHGSPAWVYPGRGRYTRERLAGESDYPPVPLVSSPDGPHSWDSIMSTPGVFGVTY